MSHHMTMGRQLVGRALTTRRAPRSSSHARGPLGTIVRAWVRQQQAQSVMCKAHRALHTNTSRHRRASDPCCCSRAFAPDPLLPLAVPTQLPRPRRQRQAATTVELQQLVATVRRKKREERSKKVATVAGRREKRDALREKRETRETPCLERRPR